jgi:hypothetical protein
MANRPQNAESHPSCHRQDFGPFWQQAEVVALAHTTSANHNEGLHQWWYNARRSSACSMQRPLGRGCCARLEHAAARSFCRFATCQTRATRLPTCRSG